MKVMKIVNKTCIQKFHITKLSADSVLEASSAKHVTFKFTTYNILHVVVVRLLLFVKKCPCLQTNTNVNNEYRLICKLIDSLRKQTRFSGVVSPTDKRASALAG